METINLRLIIALASTYGLEITIEPKIADIDKYFIEVNNSDETFITNCDLNEENCLDSFNKWVDYLRETKAVISADALQPENLFSLIRLIEYIIKQPLMGFYFGVDDNSIYITRHIDVTFLDENFDRGSYIKYTRTPNDISNDKITDLHNQIIEKLTTK